MRVRASFWWVNSAGAAGAVIMLLGPIFASVTGTLLGLVSRGWDPGFPGFGPFTHSDWQLLLVKRSPAQLSPAPARLSTTVHAILVSFIGPLEYQHPPVGEKSAVAMRGLHLHAGTVLPSTRWHRVCQLTGSPWIPSLISFLVSQIIYVLLCFHAQSITNVFDMCLCAAECQWCLITFHCIIPWKGWDAEPQFAISYKYLLFHDVFDCFINSDH